MQGQDNDNIEILSDYTDAEQFDLDKYEFGYPEFISGLVSVSIGKLLNRTNFVRGYVLYGYHFRHTNLVACLRRLIRLDDKILEAVFNDTTGQIVVKYSIDSQKINAFSLEQLRLAKNLRVKKEQEDRIKFIQQQEQQQFNSNEESSQILLDRDDPTTTAAADDDEGTLINRPRFPKQQDDVNDVINQSEFVLEAQEAIANSYLDGNHEFKVGNYFRLLGSSKIKRNMYNQLYLVYSPLFMMYVDDPNEIMMHIAETIRDSLYMRKRRIASFVKKVKPEPPIRIITCDRECQTETHLKSSRQNLAKRESSSITPIRMANMEGRIVFESELNIREKEVLFETNK